jgi:hypothetical protein
VNFRGCAQEVLDDASRRSGSPQGVFEGFTVGVG